MAQPSARLSPQPSPILEPKVATPMAHRKRRHSTMEKGEVSHGDGSAHAQGREAAMGVVNGHGHAEHVNGAKAKEPRLEVDGTNGTSLSEKVGREDGDGRPQSSDSNAYGGNGAAQLSRSPSRNGSNVSDDSFMEDLIDTVELEPYKARKYSFTLEFLILTLAQWTTMILGIRRISSKSYIIVYAGWAQTSS